jgi:hypothetical protein
MKMPLKYEFKNSKHLKTSDSKDNLVNDNNLINSNIQNNNNNNNNNNNSNNNNNNSNIVIGVNHSTASPESPPNATITTTILQQ